MRGESQNSLDCASDCHITAGRFVIPMKDLKAKTFFGVLIIVAAFMTTSSLTNGHDWGDDFAGYIMQARGVTEGISQRFIESNRYTMRQSSYPLGPIAYPWGFPVLLAPLYGMFGLNIIALKSVGVLFFVLFLGVVWIGFRKYHGDLWFFCLVCLLFLNPHIVGFTDKVLSDIPFLVFSTTAIVMMGRWLIDRRPFFSETHDAILLGVAIAAAFFVRINGILLLVTLALTQLIFLGRRLAEHGWRKALKLDFRQAVLSDSPDESPGYVNLLPYLSFFAAMTIWRIVLPNVESYDSSMLDDLSLHVVKNHVLYYSDVMSLFFAGVPHSHLLYGASIVAVLAGALKRFKSDYHIIVYTILTFLLYILWPATQGLRFLLPIVPFYCSFVLTGLEVFQAGETRVERGFRKTVCLLPIIFVLTYFTMHSVHSVYVNLIRHRERSAGPFSLGAKSMFSFIRQNTDSNSTIVFFKPRAMTMLTGRKSIMINTIEQLSRGDYLSIYSSGSTPDQISDEALIQLVKQERARLMYESSEYRIYCLTTKEAAAGIPRRGCP